MENWWWISRIRGLRKLRRLEGYHHFYFPQSNTDYEDEDGDNETEEQKCHFHRGFRNCSTSRKLQELRHMCLHFARRILTCSPMRFLALDMLISIFWPFQWPKCRVNAPFRLSCSWSVNMKLFIILITTRLSTELRNTVLSTGGTLLLVLVG